MVRISKQPDERRNDLLDIAERLFTERGFAAVRVSDIVSEMGVAQGTFYYYYQSKDEVLVALLEQKWLQIAEFINEKVTSEPDPINRLSKALTSMIIPDDAIRSDPRYRLLNDPVITKAFHPDYDCARVNALFPVMFSVVEYGIKNGVFSPLLNTHEVVKIVFLGISSYFHQISNEEFPEAIKAVCEMVERVMELPNGTLKII